MTQKELVENEAMRLIQCFKGEQSLYDEDEPQENEKAEMYWAKRRAFICADEIIKVLLPISRENNFKYSTTIDFYRQVKSKIELLK